MASPGTGPVTLDRYGATDGGVGDGSGGGVATGSGDSPGAKLGRGEGVKVGGGVASGGEEYVEFSPIASG